MIDLGGNLRVVGGTWRTGVRNPFGTGYAATFVLTNGEAVATSGNYERFVEKDGVRYSHILDGRTGKPATGIAGVTVIARGRAFHHVVCARPGGWHALSRTVASGRSGPLDPGLAGDA